MSDNIAYQSLDSMRTAIGMISSFSPCIGILPLSPSSNETRQRRRNSRNYFISSSRFFVLALCYTAVSSCWTSHAFSSPASHRTSQFSNADFSSRQRSRFFMSAVAERPAQSNQSRTAENKPDPLPRLSDFQRRMKGLVKRSGVAQKKETEKPGNLKTAHTLLDYKEALEEDSDKIVVVRFFATWCKACKAIQPSYYRMASLYPQITFLEVPVTNENANLHQGLGVPSLPYGHIYYPEAGLVEELKISKKYFPNLVRMVRWYDVGACGLDEYVPDAADDEE